MQITEVQGRWSNYEGFMGVNWVESGGCADPRWRDRPGMVAQRKYLVFNYVGRRLHKVTNIYDRVMEGRRGAINGVCED